MNEYVNINLFIYVNLFISFFPLLASNAEELIHLHLNY